MNITVNTNSEFPKAVTEQALAAKRIRVTSLASNRLDLRGKVIIAFIETPNSPAECAYSLYKTQNGWQLGIHVADVCEYVCEGSPLDIEARNRRSTVFNSGKFDRMMLPETIVDLCDLSQPVDKLAISTILELDKDFNIISSTCEKSIIRVATACVYSEIDKLQTASDSSSVMLLREKYAPFINILDNMYEIAAYLCMDRVKRGGLDCTYFRKVYNKNEQGKITSFRHVAEPDSRAMLREIGYFISGAVGKFMQKQGFPCIYNGRGAINESTLDYLSNLVKADKSITDPAKRASNIADLAKGTPYYDFVCDALAENMPFAVYSAEPISNAFCMADTVVSFFNPVSRYTDLLIQRTLKTVIEAKDPKNLNLNRQKRILAEVCIEANETEQFIHNSRKEYLKGCAFELVRNNMDNLDGFPVLTKEDGSILVVLRFGVFGTIPAESAKGYTYSPAEPKHFKAVSAEEEIILKPLD